MISGWKGDYMYEVLYINVTIFEACFINCDVWTTNWDQLDSHKFSNRFYYDLFKHVLSIVISATTNRSQKVVRERDRDTMHAMVYKRLVCSQLNLLIWWVVRHPQMAVQSVIVINFLLLWLTYAWISRRTTYCTTGLL